MDEPYDLALLMRLFSITMVSHNINDALTFSPHCYSSAGVWVRSMSAHALQPCLTNPMTLQVPSSPTSSALESPTATQDPPTTSQPAPLDLHRPSASRLARVNTVSRTQSPERTQTTADTLQNNHLLEGQTNRKASASSSQSPPTSTAASSALSQLLQSDTQPSTGTPMARDLTEALTALASNKRLLSSMQASRSFSSPDLLSLAQQLHDSGQWTAVQDMVQQEEEEGQQHDVDPSQAPARPGHDNYGTVVGRPHMVGEEGPGRLHLHYVTACLGILTQCLSIKLL